MKKFNLIGTMLESFLFILFGIIILIWPKIATNIIFNFAGILLIIVGIVSLVYFFKDKENKQSQFFLGIQTVISFIFGFMLLLGNAMIFTLILAYIVIFWFLIMAISRLVFIFQFKKANIFTIISLVLNVVVIIISIWSFFNVQVAFTIFIWIIALMLISRGIENIAITIGTRKSEE